MQVIDIPQYGKLEIRNVVLDYNGTLANGGRVGTAIRERLAVLTQRYRVYVLTADTFGTVREELAEFDLDVTILESTDHTAEKAAWITKLGAEYTVAMGNGNNDHAMLNAAKLSIALMGDEGCALPTLMAADIVCKSMDDALDLLLETGRLVATLRR